ncbi:MAG: DNA polymerase/3'-5' exonuclease PolX [bacterium]
MDNRTIANLFDEIADILEIQNENPFKVRAYRKTVQVIEDLSEDLGALCEKGELKYLPGIGKAMTEKIEELLSTGSLEYYQKIQSQIPPGLLELLKVQGMGPKKVALVYHSLGVSSLAELKKAAEEQRLRNLPGMGAKSEEKVLKGILTLEEHAGIILLGTALPLAENIVEQLRKLRGVQRISYAGSTRRGKEVIGDVDILVSAKNSKPIMEAFVSMQEVDEVLASGDTKSSVRTKDGIQIDLRVVPDVSFGAALQYFTGSKDHNVLLRERGVKQGLKINEYGVFEADSEKRLGGENEADIYEALGLPLIPPELREGMDEITAALSKEGLPKLIEPHHIKGDLHAHSNWSDGHNTIEEMAAAAMQMGYEYLVISDHSQSLRVAGGLPEDSLKKQTEIIAELNESFKNFRILTGTEVDIKSDGSLDYPENLLEHLDVVTASIHVGFSQSSEQLTRRTIRAIENPHVDVIGHFTGRLIGRRDPFPLDLDTIFAAASEHNTMLELNAHPMRLDIKDTHMRHARRYGVRFVINTDAHSVEELANMRYGILTARRGWTQAKEVFNTFPLSRLLGQLKRELR